jgi:hypothetical protein
MKTMNLQKINVNCSTKISPSYKKIIFLKKSSQIAFQSNEVYFVECCIFLHLKQDTEGTSEGNNKHSASTQPLLSAQPAPIIEM